MISDLDERMDPSLRAKLSQFAGMGRPKHEVDLGWFLDRKSVV